MEGGKEGSDIMRLAYDNKIMDATLTAASENANYPVANLKDRRLSRVFVSDNPTAISKLDDDCTSLADWADVVFGGITEYSVRPEATQTTYDGKSCFRLFGGTADLAESVGIRLMRNMGSFGSFTTFEISVYHDLVGSSFSDGFMLYIFNGATYFHATFTTGGLKIYDGASHNEVGTDLVSLDTWQDWKFIINWAAQTVDVYLDDVLQASGVDCSAASATTSGTVYIDQFSYAGGVNSCSTYIDSIQIDADAPDNLHIIAISGTDIPASCLMIAAHDIVSGSTITLEGNNTDVWTSPAFSEAVTHNANIMAMFFPGATYDYWRLIIGTNETTITIGGLFLGGYLIAPALDLGYTMDDNDASAVSISGSGQAYADEGYQYRTGKFSIPEFTHTQRAEMREFFATVGTHTPYYLTKWYEHLDKESVLYCINTKEESWKQDKDDPNKYSMTLEVREVY